MTYILLCACISAVSAAVLCTLIGPKLISRYSNPLCLVAIGFLITLSVTHIIPEAMEMADPHIMGMVLLFAILILAFFDMFVSSGHSHGAHQGSVAGILAGSAMHTFCDGLVIASAFLASKDLGFAVTAAVLSHEVAHELGDYAIMLNCGLNTRKAYIVNIVAAAGCITGAILGYFVLSKAQHLVPYALALSGSSFIYVSLSDLLPRLKKASNRKKSLMRFICILIGATISIIIAGHD